MRANDAESRKTSVQLHESDECRTQSTTYWPDMPRSRQRACLEHGLKLDLNKLARQGLVRRGARSGPYLIRWSWTHTGEGIASGLITANMEGEHEGWLRIQIGELDQTLILVPRPRHFGGYQWYFVCPVMNRYCSVVWMPPGARRLADLGPKAAFARHAPQFVKGSRRRDASGPV